MFNITGYSYGFLLGVAILGLSISNPACARHHHHKEGPPPPIEQPKVTNNKHFNPRQSSEDITPFAQQASEFAQQQATTNSIKKKNDGPPALLPGHYTKRSTKLNGDEGWVGSSQKRGKYDLGINMPVPQTADPTQNKTRGIFRRGMPTYEPNY